MDKITAQQFFQSWVETVQSRKEELLRIWRKPTEFTNAIKGSDTSVLNQIAKKQGLLCYQYENYFLDATLYKEEDLVPHLPLGQYWFRDIRVAFEHENFIRSGLYKEVSHLLITNCDLRVVVSYPDDDGKNELECLHKIIKGNRNSDSISASDGFLIIFGGEKDFVWEGYVYKDHDWVKLIN